jgi:hypothetical protein
MNKFNKGNASVLALAVAGLAVALLALGLVLSLNKNPGQGTTLTYEAALHNINLYNWQNDVVTDLTSLRTPLSGLVSQSATWNPVALSSSTPMASTTVTVTSTVGDFCFASLSSATGPADAFHLGCYITSANTAFTVLTFEDALPGADTIDFVTGTLRLRVLPQASFAAPASLLSATTSTP